MSVFTVFQEGVYRHTCMGVFDSLEGAIAAADRSAAEDVDSYHTYDVFQFELNAFNGEAGVLYSINRTKALEKLGPHEGECSPPSKDWRISRQACSRGTIGCVHETTRFSPPPIGTANTQETQGK